MNLCQPPVLRSHRLRGLHIAGWAFPLILALAAPGRADDSVFRKAAQEAGAANDPDAFDKAISDWKKSEPTSPEPFIVEANRLFSKATAVIINSGQPKPGGLALRDPKTGEVKGQIEADHAPDPILSGKALELLRKGSALAPDRLDIRAGMAYICQEAGRFDEQFEILTAMVKRTKAHPSDQKWKNGEAITEPLNPFVVEKLHSYGLFHYRKENPEGDKRFGAICGLEVAEYPDSPISWNDMALFKYFASQDVKGAAACLETAAKLDSSDLVVQFNLAKFYTELKQTAKAETIYKAIIKNNPDSDDAKDAQSKLDDLKQPAPANKPDGQN